MHDSKCKYLHITSGTQGFMVAHPRAQSHPCFIDPRKTVSFLEIVHPNSTEGVSYCVLGTRWKKRKVKCYFSYQELMTLWLIFKTNPRNI